MAKKTKEELIEDSIKTTIVTLNKAVIIERIGFLPSTAYIFGIELDFTQDTLEVRGDIADQLIDEGYTI